MRPLLKWAGNKYRIMQHLQDVLPPAQRLVEPFVGSGAVFFNSEYKKFLLNDANEDLINLYKILKSDPQTFIEDSQKLFVPKNNSKARYITLRRKFNESKDPWLRSTLFLYLNRHGFNGLCRYNSKGGFNVPFGSYKKPYYPINEILAFAKKMKKARLLCQDFIALLQQAQVGDVVYCDPPYVPLSKTASFTAYGPTTFGETQQIALAEQAESLSTRGIPVIISNHDTAFTRELYATAKIIPLQVTRNISCKVNNRAKAKEIIAVFSPV